MIQLTNKETGAIIGTISQDEVQFLIDQLEEEDASDKDYWLNRTTLDIFKDRDCPENLYQLLDSAMGDRDELEVVWAEVWS